MSEKTLSPGEDSAPAVRRSRRIPRSWYFVLLVAVAIAISYFDRLMLPVAINSIQHNIPLSNEQFSWLQTAFLLSYAAMYVIGGRLLDMLGTRRGFLLISCCGGRWRARCTACH